MLLEKEEIRGEDLMYRVAYEEATNWGFEKIKIKLFKSKSLAKQYAHKLLKGLREYAKTGDDREFVGIENIKTGKIIECWIAEEGKVVHYPRGLF